MQFRKITLQDVDNDTLLVVREMSLSPKSTLLTLINQVEFNDFNVVGVRMKVHRKKLEEKFNWEKLIASFDKGDNDKSTTDFKIPLSNLEIYDLMVDYRDERNDVHINAELAGLEVSLNAMKDKLVDIEKVLLIEPNVTVVKSGTENDNTKDDTDRGNLLFPEIYIDQLSIVDGFFNLEKSPVNNLSLFSDIDLLVEDLAFEGKDNWILRINDISGKADDIEIDHLGIAELKRKDESLIANNLFLRVNESYLSLNADFSDLVDFEDILNSKASLQVNTSKLKLKDFFPLIPNLRKEFAREPISYESVQIEGVYKISKTDISGDKIKIWLGKEHYFEGRGVFTKTGSYNESLLNFEISQLTSDLEMLDQKIPRINLPTEIKRLGIIDFSGTFDGFLNDFIAQGELYTALGKANMDIQFDLGRSHTDSIGYAGFLSLDEFDLAALLQNDDFGVVDLDFDIERGSGIDLIHSSADLQANVNHFEFKGYDYKDAIFNGRLSSKVLDGSLIIKDENVDLGFEGVVDLSSQTPLYDFQLDAEEINFCALNLTTFPCHVRLNSSINLTGANFKNIEGTTILRDVRLRQDSTVLHINELSINSLLNADSTMDFSMRSDYVDLDIVGNFNLLKMGQKMAQQVIDNHEDHVAIMNIKEDFGDLPQQNFRYKLEVKELSPVFDFLKIDANVGPNTHIAGEYRDAQAKVGLIIEAPYLAFEDIEVSNLYLNLDSQKDLGEIKLRSQDISKGNLKLNELSIVTHLRGNELFQKSFVDLNEENRIDLETKSTLLDGGYYTQFLYDDLFIDSTIWTILPNKGIGIFPNAIDIENFIVTDGYRSVSIKDLYKKGIDLSLKEFNFEFINPIINYDKLYFSGHVNAQILLDNLYKDLSIEGFVDVPDFTINGADYGSLYLKSKRKTGNILDVDLSIEKDTQNLYVKGIANIDSQYVDTHLSMQKYPLAFLEYIIDDGISETTGIADIELELYGTFDDLKMRGDGYVTEGGTKIDYIGAFYQMSNDRIIISEKFIDLGNVNLTDEKGNEADLRGGLRHNVLADFRADVYIESDNFIALNTTEEDNSLYYGLGMGPIDVSFKGPFDRIDMSVNATASTNSILYIPITSTQYGYDESFINFDYNKVQVDSNSIEQLVEQLKSSGVDFEMNLSFQRDAEVQVIYDQETSNVLIGHGEGNLQVNVKRDGDFTVFGQYNVESGEYLYTAYGLIAKPFIIEQGGTVTWTGDPINAVLDVKAYYPNLRAPLNRFLQEYVGVDPILNESDFRQRRNVDLDMVLTGNLFNPDINFDIGFPDLDGRLKTLANSKVRSLRTTENGINNQVLGLMVFNNFLPDDNPLANLQATNIAQAGGNTITEFLTSQLSLMATEYLSNLIEGEFITGVDLDIALAQNNTIGETGIPTQDNGLIEMIPDEVQLNLRNEFKNDNFVLNIGGNYVRENPLNTINNYLTGDFSLDWFITEDKRLKLQFYGVYDFDEASISRRQKYGFGINYRREFGKMNYQNIEAAFKGVAQEVQGGANQSSSLR